MNIRLVGSNVEIADCYPVMRELRPHVLESDFVSRVRSQERFGYRLARGEHGGSIVAVAGFRLGASLAWGRFLYVDDLITRGEHRRKGYGAEFLAWLRNYAAKEGCHQLHLDSGLQREDAHRFYEGHGMSKGGFHFVGHLGNEQVDFYENKLAQETGAWDLKVALDSGEKVIIIDARSPAAYEREHIPGAVNIPHREMNAETTAGLDREARVVTYCDGIGCNASTKGALNMAWLGFRVKELIGGLDWWKRDGHATEGTAGSNGSAGCGCG